MDHGEERKRKGYKTLKIGGHNRCQKKRLRKEEAKK